MLVARITEKRAELENLKQLRDLSAGVAAQMQTLQKKLSMLSNGTEGLFQCFVHMPACANGRSTAVATVLSNWHNVLRAINMASSGFIANLTVNRSTRSLTYQTVKIPKAKTEEGKGKDVEESESTVALPQTLVRIPVGEEPEHRVSSETKD